MKNNLNHSPILGAVIGDIIGSRFEKSSIKSKDFDLFTPESIFTDDTILTMAILKSCLDQTNYLDNIVDFSKRYPDRGYGGRYIHWLNGDTSRPYNSFGNGSAMRVSPIPVFFSSAEDVLIQAKKTAEVTHNHPEGVKGAQAIALAIHFAQNGHTQEDISNVIGDIYNLNFKLDNIREMYAFSATCPGTVPQSVVCFLEASSYEETVRNAVSLGGDTDTMAAMAGSIAAVHFGIPSTMVEEALKKLPKEFRELLSNEL